MEERKRNRGKVVEEIMSPNLLNLTEKNYTSKKLNKLLVKSIQRYPHLKKLKENLESRIYKVTDRMTTICFNS